MTVAAFSIIDIAPVCAHSPHDDITAVAVSPAYHQDNTLFIIFEDRVFKSTDGGFSWKSLSRGLDNTAVLASVALSPNFEADQTVLISSLGDGIYRSEDGGDTWAQANAGLEDYSLGQVVLSPKFHADKIVLAAGSEGGLFRSEDGGDTWKRVLDESVRATVLSFSSDPTSSFAALGDKAGNLWYSQDSGEHWQLDHQLPESGAITALAISDSFSVDGIFFVGTEKRGAFKTDDGGASFRPLKRGPSKPTLSRRGKRIRISPTDKYVTALALAPNFARTQTLLATTWYEAVFKSDNGGRGWRKYDYGVRCDSQANTPEYFKRHFNSLSVSKTFDLDETVFLAGFDGLFKSVDGGQHWLELETRPLSAIQGLDVSAATDGGYDVTFFTYGAGVYTKRGQETLWEIDNNGLYITRLVDMVFSPSYTTDQTVFSGVWGALVKSTDGGRTWQQLDLGGSGPNRPYPTDIVLSPEYADDQTLFFATRAHGIMKSTDGGQTHSVLWDGLGRVIYWLFISPDFANDETLFASVRGKGVYKSQDGGQTWNAANEGLSFVAEWQASAAQEIPNQDTIIAISPDYARDKTVFAGSPKGVGLYRSDNGGLDWHRITGNGLDENSRVIGLAMSPDYRKDRTFIISLRARGLFRTEDGGKTFTEIGQSLIADQEAIGFIKFSPHYVTDGTIYAVSEENIFYSSDRGDTWQALSRPRRYEERRDIFHFEGRWDKVEDDSYSAMAVFQSSQKGGSARLHFVGSSVLWLGTVGPDQGMAKVMIDGRYITDVDLYSPEPNAQVTLFSASDLDDGPHTITIEVLGNRDPASSGNRVTIDAFDVE